MGSASHPALALPSQIFDHILCYLKHPQDKCAAQAVCRAWRHLGEHCIAAHQVVGAGRMDREERIDSLADWLHPRAAAVRRLSFEHYDSPRHNEAAAAALEPVAPHLTHLILVVRKSTRNRRGLPGPASMAWFPVCTALAALDLNIGWEIREEEGLQLKRWAPNLRALALRCSGHGRGAFVLETPGRDCEIPETVADLSIFRDILGVEALLQRQWTPLWLSSLALDYSPIPSEIDGHMNKGVDRSEYTYQFTPRFQSTLGALRGVTQLSLTAVNGDDVEVFKALASLTGLQDLRLHLTPVNPEDYEEKAEAAFMGLKRLKTLHLVTHECAAMPGWAAAAKLGAFPELQELHVLQGWDEDYRGAPPLPAGAYVSSLQRLAVDVNTAAATWLEDESGLLRFSSRAASLTDVLVAAGANAMDAAAPIDGSWFNVGSSQHGSSQHDVGSVVRWLIDLGRVLPAVATSPRLRATIYDPEITPEHRGEIEGVDAHTSRLQFVPLESFPVDSKTWEWWIE